mmetsp:Transcript_27207/g.77831  ORF Transcript_27207/g.77831 Transcript_27207/m.77831 type:complete len:206 (-) Transcript_27207:393-1010(-)
MAVVPKLRELLHEGDRHQEHGLLSGACSQELLGTRAQRQAQQTALKRLRADLLVGACVPDLKVRLGVARRHVAAARRVGHRDDGRLHRDRHPPALGLDVPEHDLAALAPGEDAGPVRAEHRGHHLVPVLQHKLRPLLAARHLPARELEAQKSTCRRLPTRNMLQHLLLGLTLSAHDRDHQREAQLHIAKIHDVWQHEHLALAARR